MLNFKVIKNQQPTSWVVFIHGAGGSIQTWNYQVPELGKFFNLLLIDLRDHGSSKAVEPNFEHYQFNIISQDIKTILDHLQIHRAHFITLSFGSVLIQDFTMRFPGIADRIVIAGGIFKGNLAIRLFVALAKVFNYFLSYPTMYSLFSYLLMPRQRNQKARRIYQLQAQKLSSAEYMKWVGLYGEFFRLLDQFYHHMLPVPTLVVMGGDDYIFKKSAKDFVNKQPGTQLKILDGVGHICNIEAPQFFNHLVVEFLVRHSIKVDKILSRATA